MKSCTIIGISDKREQWFSPEVAAILSSAKVFSGGKRHHDIIRPYLPAGSIWIDIVVPIARVFEEYKKYDDMVILASGDPLFYGFASTVQRACPTCRLKIYPCFNSLQMLAHRMMLPYQDMHVVSLTGRSWDKFDEAVIQGERLIGCLTDRTKTPHAIYQRMKEYGYDNYNLTVGENLGNETEERVGVFAEGNNYSCPNCLILQKVADRPRPFGIPESDFLLLDGRTKMITKMPVRLLSLSMLDLRNRHSFWDIGFCTGSVSIEAKLQFPHLAITAFEIRPEGKQLMYSNARKFGAPGITTVIGDFLEQPLSEYPAPDAVFIGGHGGKLKEIIAKVASVKNTSCPIVFNSVSKESKTLFEQGIEEVGMKIISCTYMVVDDNNPIYILKAL